ncbi:MAG: nickel pincer cofactor biosynthesis protein LarB [Acidobacteriota bacterium]
MERKEIEKMLRKVRGGSLSISAALEKLKNFAFEDIGFARIDHHRHLRRGFPEVIFGQGKKDDQIIEIIKRMRARKQSVFVTRASRDLFRKVKKLYKNACFNELARAITIIPEGIKPERSGILVVTAGTSDVPVAEEAALTAEVLGEKVERIYDVGVAGLHRLISVKDNILEANVIIVVAGMEGALPSVIAGLVDKPVIGVPTSTGYGTSFSGVGALLGMLNSCASGLVVVNIDNGFGAGCAASLINRLTS